MDWSIQQIARLSGTTSRTLRHYGDVGLLPPTRTGPNGYRYYDAAALARLQRILILRDLGLSLAGIRGVLEGQTDHADALEGHLDALQQERDRLDRQIGAVVATIDALRGGEQLMAEQMFDGFDHTVYREEVVDRWGANAYADGDRWWRALTDADKAAFQREHAEIAEAWRALAAAGADPAGAEARALAERHRAWIAAGWQGRPVPDEALVGLGELYVADPRFRRNYDTDDRPGVAELVRDAFVALTR